MNAGEVINDWRRNVNEPNTNRFTVADSIDFLNKACRQVAIDLPYTEGTWSFPTIAGQKEYAMLETIRILRVYILGAPDPITGLTPKQLLEPTDIPSMEGDNQNYFDASSGFRLGQPPLTPQWIAEQPRPYPNYNHQTNQFGYGKSSHIWRHGDKPRWYMRYGNIGFVPPPNAVYTVNVDHIPVPPTVVTLSDLLEFGEVYRDILVYKMSEYSRQADGSSDSQKNNQLYQTHMKQQKEWWDKFQIGKPMTFIPWVRRNNSGGRFGRNWGGWGQW
jgi:hypothetical protein